MGQFSASAVDLLYGMSSLSQNKQTAILQNAHR